MDVKKIILIFFLCSFTLINYFFFRIQFYDNDLVIIHSVSSRLQSLMSWMPIIKIAGTYEFYSNLSENQDILSIKLFS